LQNRLKELEMEKKRAEKDAEKERKARMMAETKLEMLVGSEGSRRIPEAPVNGAPTKKKGSLEKFTAKVLGHSKNRKSSDRSNSLKFTPSSPPSLRVRSLPVPETTVTSRLAHSMNLVDNRIYIIGGQDETGRLILEVGVFDVADLENVSYKTLDVKLIEPLVGHTATTIEKTIYVFGGGDGKRATNRLRHFNTATQTWHTPTCQGRAPLPRVGHSAVHLHNHILIIGGFVPRVGYTNHVFALTYQTSTWTQVQFEATDSPWTGRVGHSSHAVGDSVLVFGGSEGKGKGFADFWKLGWDESSKSYSMCDITRDFSGSLPSSRTCHQSLTIGESKILIFGGTGGAEGTTQLDSTHLIEIDSMLSHQVTLVGDTLPPLSRHASCGAGKQVFTFGGGADKSVTNSLILLEEV
jgi:hypothetical protein